MLKRDLLRNVIIFSVLAAIIIGLRVFIYTPYRVTDQDSNAYLAKNDLVLATRKQDIKRGDFVPMKWTAKTMSVGSLPWKKIR